MGSYQTGDRVVYAKPKVSTHPSPRAKHLDPAALGEEYTYEVDKYWTVTAVEGDVIEVVTRRGKRHRLSVHDPRLRRPTLLDRWRARNRFPQAVPA